MTFYAMAVLLPWDAREILREDFLEDESRFPVIVEKCDLPESIVRLILSDRWPRLYQSISGNVN
jgi:hypothetical protein